MTSPYLPEEELSLPEHTGPSPLLAFYRRWRDLQALETALGVLRQRWLPASQAAELLGSSEPQLTTKE